MTKKIKKELIFIFLFGFLIPVSFVLAETCPSQTTVSGTNVTFVGELTDMGGDTTTAVWFEYGQTTAYGQKTSEQTLTQTGVYCITISGLSPCTTYHYRAIAKNSAGTSYGEDKSFTTTCQSEISVNKLVRNLSDGTGWGDSVLADPSEIISFSIRVMAGNSSLDNVIVKDTLPDKIVYRQNSLKIDGLAVSGDITSGYNIGYLAQNQTKTITFDADILGSDKFVFGDTQLINSAIAYTGNASGSDTAKIVVTKKAVAGAATEVSTGLTNNLFLDSFAIPLAITLLLVWLLKARIIKFEEWLDKRKNEYQHYKSKKLLQLKIKKIRLLESLRNRL